MEGPQSHSLLHSAEVEFEAGPYRFEGEVFQGRRDELLDLAVVSLPIEDLPPRTPKMAQGEPRNDAVVHIIGHPRNQNWILCQSAVRREDQFQGDTRSLTLNWVPCLEDGYSGGVVIDDDGNFLGMYVANTGPNEDAQDARVVHASAILRALEGWRVPTDNILDR